MRRENFTKEEAIKMVIAGVIAIGVGFVIAVLIG